MKISRAPGSDDGGVDVVSRAGPDVDRSTTGTATPRVLVVDDDEQVGRLVRIMLEAIDVSVTTTQTLEQALEAMCRADYDIVLTDLHLEAQHGFDVARRIRAQWPQVTIGLLTGAAHGLTRAQITGHGIDLVVGKPFRYNQLLSAIQQGMVLRTRRRMAGLV